MVVIVGEGGHVTPSSAACFAQVDALRRLVAEPLVFMTLESLQEDHCSIADSMPESKIASSGVPGAPEPAATVPPACASRRCCRDLSHKRSSRAAM